MLNESFIHLPGIGPTREAALWRRGITCWRELLDHDHLVGGGNPAPVLLHELGQLQQELTDGRFERTAELLPRREHWRALCVREQSATRPLRWLALDIETTGLEASHSTVTTIGLWGHATGFEPVALTATSPDWAHSLPGLLAATDVLLTFNGAGFDLPFLRAVMPGLAFPPFHVDLCPLLRRLGLKGGLKLVQARLGFRRAPGLDELGGYSAVILWGWHRRGRKGALETLVRYCLEDVVVLPQLARIAYDRMAADLGRNWRCWVPPTVPLDSFPFEPTLIARLRAGGY